MKIGKTIVICSGYFDPIHKGHLQLLNEAKQYGDELWVIVNNDEQAKQKKGKSFMDENERCEIMRNIKAVDRVILSIDEDRSVIKTLETLYKLFPEFEFIFTNGGDVLKKDCREDKLCKELGITTVYGLGKKIQSSSKLTGLKAK
jgi:D-beta-D-heptose 7-phosphate kinase/D-beta-D-heptose 1-phosphate adenosyltransferase